ncbi:unnamed protein product [Parajaminaea phylloscopi]
MSPWHSAPEVISEAVWPLMDDRPDRGRLPRLPPQSQSGHSTPRGTPSVSALASPTAPLSRTGSPRPIALKEVDDDAFAPHPAARGLSSSIASSVTSAVSQPIHPVAATTEPISASAPEGSSSQKALGEILVISGGSGYNALLGATPGNTTYVMPISDNGGSSSEIIRTLSGPSIGDIRSRLVRLIPLTTSPRLPGRPVPPKSNDRLHALLSYRLPTTGRTRDIKSEWLDLLEGKHALWRGIEADRKEVVRGFLVHFQSEILRRAHRNFNLRGLSVGNAFLSAAQMFFRSIQSAIFLFSATTLVAGTGSSVLPCINTNHTATIAAELEDGSTIVGQCEISHPPPSAPIKRQQADQSSEDLAAKPKAPYRHLLDEMWSRGSPAVGTSGLGTPASIVFDPLRNVGSDLHAALTRSRDDQNRRWMEDKTSSGRRTVGTLQDGLEPDDDDAASQSAGGEEAENDDEADFMHQGNIVFSKDADDDENPLPSRIRDIFYINSYRNIVWPAPNMSYLASLGHARTLIYSCGSLYTSIVPSLALRGVATAIAKSATLKHKVLLLNTTHDRETPGYTALDFIHAIQRALNTSNAPESQLHHTVSDGTDSSYPTSSFITELVYHVNGDIAVDVKAIEGNLGIRCIPVGSSADKERKQGRKSSVRFAEQDVREALWQITQGAPDSDKPETVAVASPTTERKRQMEGFTYLPLQ